MINKRWSIVYHPEGMPGWRSSPTSFKLGKPPNSTKMVIFILPKPFWLRKPFGRSSGPSGNFIYIYLVGGLEHEFYFSIYWEYIFPTDEVIFFRGIGLNHQADTFCEVMIIHWTRKFRQFQTWWSPENSIWGSLFGHKQLPCSDGFRMF